jgi:putative PIN family toxin of toxin-antitoxin system
MRLVLDTNVIVAAFRSPRGGSAALVKAAVAGRFDMLASMPLFVEYEAVLARPAHAEAAGAAPGDADRFLDVLAAHLEPVDIVYLWRPQLSDPDDEMVLECAVNGRADAIVTMEATVFDAAARRFGVGVMTPRAAWAMLRA